MLWETKCRSAYYSSQEKQDTKGKLEIFQLNDWYENELSIIESEK